MVALHTKGIIAEIRSKFDRGASSLTTIVFSLFGLALFYCAYCIIPFFYYYFEFQNQMAAIVALADTYNDTQIRQRLGKVMKELQLPAEPGDIKIDRRDRFIKLTLKYNEVFYIPLGSKNYDIHVFHMHAEAEGPY